VASKYADNGYRLEPAAIEQRVVNLEHGIKDLGVATAQQMGSLAQQISNLSTKLDERGKIPWPALAVMLSFLTIIGGLVWYPVKEGQERQQRILERIIDTTVTQKDLDVRVTANQRQRDDWQRGADERSKANSNAIEAVAKTIVPRGEHEEKWRSIDEAIKRNQERLDEVSKLIVPRGEHEEKWRSYERAQIDTQRQIDEIKKAYNDLYSPRDAFASMQKRLDDVERRLSNATAKSETSK
jgi:RNase H-fold protein (predicted Holliday junction resolvase)